MAGYIRHGVNCESVAQPNSTTETDVYGNSFENWCADYEGMDLTNLIVKRTGCAPQDPKGKKDKFIFNTVDNGVRTPKPYVDSPLWPTTYINDSIPPGTELRLGSSGDRDITIFVEGNQRYLTLEPNTEIISSVVWS